MDKTAIIKMLDNDGVLEVSGPYNEMKECMGSLKSKGFQWNPTRKVWYCQKAKLTPIQLKNTQKLIDQANGGAGAASKHGEETVKLFEKAVGSKILGYHFAWTDISKVAIYLTGRTYELKDLAFASGGRWNSNLNGYMFTPDSVNPAGFDKFLDQCVAAGKRFEQQLDEVKSYLREDKTWPSINVRMKYMPSRNGDVVTVAGDTRPHKDMIKGYMPNTRWDSSMWACSASATTEAEINKLVKYFDKEEANAAGKAKEEPATSQQAPPGTRTNLKPGECAVCFERVEAGDGWLGKNWVEDNGSDSWRPRGGEPEDGRMMWTVVHKDEDLCKANQARNKARRDAIREERVQQAVTRAVKVKATEELEKYCRAHGEKPEGRQEVRGETVRLTGGDRESVLMEPGKDYFWFCFYNGSDGDDWSHNNLNGHSFGWRTRMTPETEALIETARIDAKTASARIVDRFLASQLPHVDQDLLRK